MEDIWKKYLTIKGGEFPTWWASLSKEQKKEFRKHKEKNENK